MIKKATSIQEQTNDSGKYLRLFGSLFLAFAIFIASLVLLFFLMRLVFSGLTFLPWIDYIYVVFLVSVPAAIFLTAFSVFFVRSRTFPGKAVKWISLIIISIFIILWLIFFVWDIANFIKFQYTQIKDYRSYNMLFLFSNIATIFFLGVLQALSRPAETDWLTKARQRQETSGL